MSVIRSIFMRTFGRPQGLLGRFGGIIMALFIMGLEIIVAGVQAFLFSLLAAVFIGQVRSAHH